MILQKAARFWHTTALDPTSSKSSPSFYVFGGVTSTLVQPQQVPVVPSNARYTNELWHLTTLSNNVQWTLIKSGTSKGLIHSQQSRVSRSVFTRAALAVQ